MPERMTFDIAEPYPVYEDPLFRYPFLPFALTSFAAVALGVAARFLEEARNLLEARLEVWPSPRVEAGLQAVSRAAERSFQGSHPPSIAPSTTPGRFTKTGP